MAYLNPIVNSVKTKNEKKHILEGCQLQYVSLKINMPVLNTLTTEQHKVIVYYSQPTQTVSLIEEDKGTGTKKTQNIPRISLTFPQFSGSNDENDEKIDLQLQAHLTKYGLELIAYSLAGETSTVYSCKEQIINEHVNTSNTILDTSNK